MNAQANAINWFEISVTDMARAKAFYEAVFAVELYLTEMAGMQMAFFPYDQSGEKVSGGLVKSDMHTPSADGAVLYLNGNPDLSEALGRVEAAGGQVVMPKTQIDENTGYMAFFMDTEGNRIGLHSRQ